MSKTSFFEKVYAMVKEIPEGKVATYGQIAGILGTKDARKVGWALHGNSDPDVPCHRVVNKEGRVSVNYAFSSRGRSAFGRGGWEEQKRKLVSEGVKFRDEMHVDLGSCLWQQK